MNWLKENLGLDWFDLTVHAALTGLGMGILGELGARDATVMLAGGASIVLLAVRRSWALRKRGPSIDGITSGEMAAMRFEEMEQRLAHLEATEARVAELEERLEFAERLLAEPTADRLLPANPDREKGARR